MKGAKELAEMLCCEVSHCVNVGAIVVSSADAQAIATHLDRLVAIDSAEPEEVREIAERLAGVRALPWTSQAEQYLCDIATLLAIVQRQEGEIADMLRRPAESRALRAETERDNARAEVERLKADLQQTKDELSAAAHSARSYAEQMDMAIADKDATREASDRWQRKLHAEYGVTEKMRAQVSALAQENARLINEVGELDAAAREQRLRAEVLARGLAAYRSGGYTQGQLWENEEGKAVT